MSSSRIAVPVSALLIALSLTVAALGRQIEFKDRFPGRWTPDKEKTKKYAGEHKDAKAIPDEVLDSLGDRWLEFDESGSAKVHIDESRPNGESVAFEGNWEITQEEDQNHAEIKITINLYDRDDVRSGKAEFLDDDTLVISFDDDPAIVLVRSEDEAQEKKGASGGEKKKPSGDSDDGGGIRP